MRYKILIIFAFIILLPINLHAKISMPQETHYPNPYKLMIEKEIKTIEGKDWKVFANRKGAPVYREIGTKQVGTADYLEPFRVERRTKGYLWVRSKKRSSLRGWMDMRHLLLLPQRAIKDPAAGVFYKVFLKVRIKSQSGEESGVNVLRFRNGPGKGDGPYEYIGKDVPKVGNLFLYVYGVHFIDQNNDYQDTSTFRGADYVLVGDAASYGGYEEDIGKKIRGWIPKGSAVWWNTRQALEIIPGREKYEAHKFDNVPLLKEYFSLQSKEKRKDFLSNNSENILPDTKEVMPPRSGQELRDIVLGNEHRYENVVFERIGFIGKRGGPVAGDKQNFFADLQEGMKYLEIFFLIDATKSMEPCLSAVAKVTKSIIKEVGELNINLILHGAVYRDKTEGSRIYEAWDGDNESIDEWFRKLSRDGAFSAQSDDYPEALFHGIQSALNGWDPKNDFSMRVMIILGDAADNNLGPPRNKLVKELKAKMVLPIAIHFAHECTNEHDPNRCRKEIKAMDDFKKQFNNIHEEFYDMPNMVNVRSVPKSDLKGELEKHIKAVSNSIVEFVKLLPDIRLGMKTIKEALCNLAYSEEGNFLQGCMECENPNDLMAFFRTCSPSGDSIGTGLIIAHLNQLCQKDPTLCQYITKNPEIGFTEGYIALQEGNIKLTRPVLLLSDAELLKIAATINKIRLESSYCSKDANRGFLIEAISTILGDLLFINPESVTIEQAEKWFKMTVDPHRSTIGAEDIVQQMCDDEHHYMWGKFLEKLKKVPKFIWKLRGEAEKSGKFYRDLENIPYFWIYPEELFPHPGAD